MLLTDSRLAFVSLIIPDVSLRRELRHDEHAFHEVICPQQGVYRVCIEGRHLSLHPGQVLWLPAGTAHTPEYTLIGGPHFYVAGWHGAALPFPPASVLADSGRRILMLLSWMRDLSPAEGPLATRVLDRLLACLLDALIQAKGHGGSPADPVSRMQDHIRKNLHFDLDVATIATTAGLSAVQARRLFKRCSGETPHDFLVRMRLERAVQLIRETRQPLEAISRQVGLRSRSHLSRLLRDRLGLGVRTLRGPAVSGSGEPSALPTHVPSPVIPTEAQTDTLTPCILFARNRLDAVDFPDPTRPMLRLCHGLWWLVRGTVVARLGGEDHDITAGTVFITTPGDHIQPEADALAQVVTFDLGNQGHRRMPHDGRSGGSWWRTSHVDEPDPSIVRLASGSWHPVLASTWNHEAVRTILDIQERWFRSENLHLVANHILGLLLARLLADERLPDPVDRFMAIARERLSRADSLNHLALRSGLERLELERCFRQRLNQSPAAWLDALRQDEARRLLADPSKTVVMVANACGYRSASAFVRRFRRETGTTPAAWQAGLCLDPQVHRSH